MRVKAVFVFFVRQRHSNDTPMSWVMNATLQAWIAIDNPCIRLFAVTFFLTIIVEVGFEKQLGPLFLGDRGKVLMRYVVVPGGRGARFVTAGVDKFRLCCYIGLGITVFLLNPRRFFFGGGIFDQNPI